MTAKNVHTKMHYALFHEYFYQRNCGCKLPLINSMTCNPNVIRQCAIIHQLYHIFRLFATSKARKVINNQKFMTQVGEEQGLETGYFSSYGFAFSNQCV